MTPLAHASAALSQQGAMTTGEAVLFGVVALVTVACGLGVLTAKRAVSAAINMIGIMIGLAVLYIASEAPFLGMTQVVVYTGAVMTLVLFVIMLVGVGGEEPVAGTTSPLQRPLLIVMGMALVAVLVAVVVRTPLPAAAGLDDGRLAVPPTIAEVLFGQHVVTMQLTALLLVIAAVGALALTHRQRIRAKRTQGEVAQDKMRAYAATGAHPGQKPMPGVYASTNSAAAPALDAAGRAVEDSVPRVLRARGQELDLAEASPERAVAPGGQAAAPRTERGTGLSGMPAMPGAPAPRVHQPRAAQPEPSAEPEQEAAQEATSATSEPTSTQEDA